MDILKDLNLLLIINSQLWSIGMEMKNFWNKTETYFIYVQICQEIACFASEENKIKNFGNLR